MQRYLKSVLLGLAAALVVVVAAWGLGVGPRVTRVTPPPTQPAPHAPPSDEVFIVDTHEEVVSVTDVTVSGYEVVGVAVAFVGAFIWQVRRTRQ